MPGFLAALIAKFAGLGALTKVVVVATAALAMTAAGGAAGVLPVREGLPDLPVAAQDAIQRTTAPASSSVDSLPPTTSGGTDVQVARGAPTTSTDARSAPATTAASTKVTSSPAVTVPKVPKAAGPIIPALPTLPSCVANLFPTGGTALDPVTLVAKLPACILSLVTAKLPLDSVRSVLGSARLPVDVSKCLSSVLNSVPAFVGGNLSGLPQLLAACLPKGSIQGMGSIPGLGSIPGFESGR